MCINAFAATYTYQSALLGGKGILGVLCAYLRLSQIRNEIQCSKSLSYSDKSDSRARFAMVTVDRLSLVHEVQKCMQVLVPHNRAVNTKWLRNVELDPAP